MRPSEHHAKIMKEDENMQLARVDTEQEQLDVLLLELARIEGQQTKLRDAVTRSQAIVVHPRREAFEEESDSDSPLHKAPSPMKVVASAGLVGFNVAQDLLTLDFSTPEEAPEEFRAMPFNSQKSVEFKPGLSGSFGVMDPMSKELHTYLKRLEEQQRQVLEIIAGKRREFSSSRLQSGQSVGRSSRDLPPSASQTVPAPGMRRKSTSRDGSSFAEKPRLVTRKQHDERHAAPAIQGVPSSSAEMRTLGPRTASELQTALPPIKTRVPNADAMTLSSIEQWREKAKEMGGGTAAAKVAKDKAQMKENVGAPKAIKFAAKAPDVKGVSLPSHLVPLGVLQCLLYVMCFAFYLFCRSTTISATEVKASLFAYQLIFLLAECCLFSSGMAFALNKVRALYPIKHPHKPDKQMAASTSDPAALEHPSKQYQVQIFVFGGGRNRERMQKSMQAALDMELPEGCNRFVYFIDPFRDTSKAEYIASLGLDNVIYVPAAVDAINMGKRCNRSDAFNQVLNKVYPKEAVMGQCDVIMALDDDQVVHKLFLKKLLPHFQNDDIRLVYSPPGYENITRSHDVFNQLEDTFYNVIVPGYEAWGYGASASSAFIVRADAILAIKGFPSHSTDLGLSLGIEFKIAKFLTKFHNEVLVKGLAPTTTAGVYDMKWESALGRYQALFCPRPPHRGSLLFRFKVLFHSCAWSQLIWAGVLPLMVLVPILRIYFDYFPFIPNKWFGLGFLLYYLLATPSIYFQPGDFSSVLSMWHWIVASYNLYFTNLLALIGAAFHDYVPRTTMGNSMTTEQAQNGKATETVINIHVVSASNNKKSQGAGKRKDAEADQPSVLRFFPFGSALLCGLSLATGAVGCWLLFDSKGSLRSSRVSKLDLDLLKTNLALILSILWAGVHAAIFSVPVFYSTTTVFTGLTYDYYHRPGNRSTGPTSKSIALWSSACFIMTVLLMVLASVACLGLGRGFDTIKVDMVGHRYDAYSSALASSIRFLEAQRSGYLTNNLVQWRGNSGIDDIPTGGYYLGTNNLKVTSAIAVVTTHLAWAMLESPEGFGKAEAADQAMAELKWGADYLIACQTGGTEYVALVGNVDLELHIWARPEDMTWPRPSQKLTSQHPGADVVANAAAALAAVSLAFQEYDYSYSKLTLRNARNLYAFANTHRGLSSEALPQLAKLYNASGYHEDLLFAALWMHRATEDPVYLSNALDHFHQIHPNEAGRKAAMADWVNQYWPALFLLWQLTGEDLVEKEIKSFIVSYMYGENGITLTPHGLSWSPVGAPLSSAANAAMIALLYSKSLGDGINQLKGLRYRCWARGQLQYILGATGRCFVGGLDGTSPSHMASPGASCPNTMQPCASLKNTSRAFLSPDPNPHILSGALVYGPDAMDQFFDDRRLKDTTVNIAFNSGMFVALSLILQRSDWMRCDERPGLLEAMGIDLPGTFF
eukprot:jgi/Botrbrau1/20901/Bobra.0135s0032.1